jgi:hypothetical protein
MSAILNIASNEETIFFSINRRGLNSEIIENVNRILKEEFRKRTLIPFVSDVEQNELNLKLSSLSNDDKEIVRTEYLRIEL